MADRKEDPQAGGIIGGDETTLTTEHDWELIEEEGRQRPLASAFQMEAPIGNPVPTRLHSDAIAAARTPDSAGVATHNNVAPLGPAPIDVASANSQSASAGQIGHMPDQTMMNQLLQLVMRQQQQFDMLNQRLDKIENPNSGQFQPQSTTEVEPVVQLNPSPQAKGAISTPDLEPKDREKGQQLTMGLHHKTLSVAEATTAIAVQHPPHGRYQQGSVGPPIMPTLIQVTVIPDCECYLCYRDPA